MEIILTGTGTPIPDANRAGPSTLVKAGETQILVDAGRGVVMRLAGALTGAPALDAVLITHLHSDHVCALNDIITTHWVMSQESATLKIFGPVGTEEFVRRQMHALEPDIGYRIEHHDFLERGPQLEVTDLEAGDSFSVNDVHVSTAATEHYGVTSSNRSRSKASKTSSTTTQESSRQRRQPRESEPSVWC
jgi:ribonuclease Z